MATLCQSRARQVADPTSAPRRAWPLLRPAHQADALALQGRARRRPAACRRAYVKRRIAAPHRES